MQTLQTLRRVLLRYDLALSTQSGDRPSLFARLASKRAFGFKSVARGGFVRDLFMTGTVPTPPNVHRVDQVLALTDIFGLIKLRDMKTPAPAASLDTHRQRKYVVLHPGAAFRYKRWNSAAWRETTQWFNQEGFEVVITGGRGSDESTYLSEIFSGLDVIRLDGKLSWPQLTALLAGATLFVGVDTSVTHLAAAVGTRTIAIFGPTNPLIWSPIGLRSNENVHVLQNKTFSCVPCQREGCDGQINSQSECLDELEASTLIKFMKTHASRGFETFDKTGTLYDRRGANVSK